MAIISQTNSVLTIASVTIADAGVYTVEVTGSCGKASSSASLTVNANLVINPTNLDFGQLVVGQVSTQSFQLSNNGGLTLTGSASATNPFAIQSGSLYTLSPGQTGLVTVTFSSASAGNFSNALVFISNGGNSTNSVKASAVTPAELSVLPSSLDFGTIAAGSSRQLSFLLTNLGGAAVMNGTATVLGGPFRINSGTPFSIPGFGSTNLMLQFSPLKAGSFSNVVVLTTSNGGGTTNTLTGVAAVPPIADFSGSPTNGTKPLQVTFSDSSTGTITNWFWNFGDGTTSNSTGTVVSLTYLAAGTNTVTLTATGPLGSSIRARTNYIIAINPLQITGLRASAADVLINFSSKSGQFYRVEYTDSLSPASWKTAIDFVPGNGGIVTAIHIGGAGQPSRFYRIRLLTSVEVAPAANFTANPVFGQAPLKVTFVDVSTGYVTNRFWDFGDGSTTNTTAASVSHIYPSAGTNTVRLTVTGPTGTDTHVGNTSIVTIDYLLITAIQTSGSNVLVSFTSKSSEFYRLEHTDSLSTANWKTAIDFIPGTGDIVSVVHFNGAAQPSRFYRVRLLTALDLGPTANFAASSTFGPAPLSTTFTDSSTGYITNRFWDFGDGSTTNTTAGTLSHIYSSAGTNTVTLMISGPFGTSASIRTNYITVINQLLITSIRVSVANVIISFTSTSGQSYRLEYTDAPLLTSWITAIDSIAGTGGVVSVTHVGGAIATSRFYRLRLLP